MTTVYENLREIEKLYWEPSSTFGIPFVDGLGLFKTGRLDYIEEGNWREMNLDFTISAVLIQDWIMTQN